MSFITLSIRGPFPVYSDILYKLRHGGGARLYEDSVLLLWSEYGFVFVLDVTGKPDSQKPIHHQHSNHRYGDWNRDT